MKSLIAVLVSFSMFFTSVVPIAHAAEPASTGQEVVVQCHANQPCVAEINLDLPATPPPAPPVAPPPPQKVEESNTPLVVAVLVGAGAIVAGSIVAAFIVSRSRDSVAVAVPSPMPAK